MQGTFGNFRPLVSGVLMFLAVAGGTGVARSAPAAEPAGTPAFYAYCMDNADAKHRSLPEQVRMLGELGFEGVGYPLWLGPAMDQNLKLLDEAGLKLRITWLSVNINPKAKPYDEQAVQAFRKLRGRPVTVCVLLRGFPSNDPQGLEPAAKVLRELGDLATANGLRISIYNHVSDWTESLPFIIQVVKKTNHPQVGFNFNLCHWLKVDSGKDYRPLIRENVAKLFVVAINGAQLGAKDWTNGLIQPLDRGDFDNRQLLETLRDAGYAGPIGLMCYGIPGDAREHLERSMGVWKSWQAKAK